MSDRRPFSQARTCVAAATGTAVLLIALWLWDGRLVPGGMFAGADNGMCVQLTTRWNGILAFSQSRCTVLLPTFNS